MGAIDDSRQLQQAREQRVQQTRADILAKTRGGHAGPTGYTTDFTAADVGGLDGLRAMIEHADPSALTAVADHWTAVNEALLAAQADFRTHTSAALEHWTGAAADGFAARAQQLHEALGNGAQYAAHAGSGVSAAATALTAAKLNMPKAPSEWQKITRKATSETGDQQFNADLRSGISRQVALDLDGGQLSATEERHQQAIVVMQTLEGEYNRAGTTIGKAPRDPVEAFSVWPPPSATITHDPVGTPDSEPVTSPGMAGAVHLTQVGAPGKGSVAYGITPGQGPGVAVGGATPGEGITGGERLPTTPGPSTTITGISGGLGSGGRADSTGERMSIPLPLVAGIGGATGHGHFASGLSLGGAAVGFSGTQGATGGTSSFAGGFDGAAEHLGASSASSRTGGGLVGNEEADQPGAEATTAAEEAMGMGGFPGGLSSQDRKRKRRPRPHYLVEDPENWNSGVTVNPPVIM
ncbi:hypothetical protein [Streptacidiphilus sp. P02-A3a]|uniref:hypothetical protein n=1 Tax=Streptacidiphilus sp. P02-A3a TaxID=2704468 RepID=UPI0015F91A54|nr:hypothetical protein [Streptacidiphilus sp. P02-A3a]QMU72393.1 hypothetical protein GXP74_33280 [Streptacidiphilus sp. P02-A3a]